MSSCFIVFESRATNFSSSSFLPFHVDRVVGVSSDYTGRQWKFNTRMYRLHGIESAE